ncbi:hypothetical protein [uncultured Methylibium sp.]|uniref:hypothetical protein n=1 Tax=uncultured Methylibium sp. TaxID=381093 RepID=UPI0025CB7AB8|nr:hypothetical protein [uncultured Methylibium sp.]
MQAAPAVAVEVKPDRVSHLALCGLAGVSLTVAVVWAMQRGDKLGWGVLVLVVIGLLVALPGLLRMAIRRLRWDGQVWHLSTQDRLAEPAAVGQVAVALDLGDWMLLRFEPASRSTAAAQRWLPVSRETIGPSWHALRCAVHARRSAAVPAAPAGPAF